MHLKLQKLYLNICSIASLEPSDQANQAGGPSGVEIQDLDVSKLNFE